MRKYTIEKVVVNDDQGSGSVIYHNIVREKDVVFSMTNERDAIQIVSDLNVMDALRSRGGGPYRVENGNTICSPNHYTPRCRCVDNDTAKHLAQTLNRGWLETQK